MNRSRLLLIAFIVATIILPAVADAGQLPARPPGQICPRRPRVSLGPGQHPSDDGE
jgi:hypothetical protein